MKLFHRTFITRSCHRLLISIAVLLAALAFVTPSACAQAGNTATGDQALSHDTNGIFNTADGYQALFSNDVGSYNVAVGAFALYYNFSYDPNGSQNGSGNTAVGAYALYGNSIGAVNTAVGYFALTNNSTGSNNTALGFLALNQNTIGNYNTADGTDALGKNVTGNSNTAGGEGALGNNTTGNNNTANGFAALTRNATGDDNTAGGAGALSKNATGANNTAEGVNALANNTVGSDNIAVGAGAGAALTIGSNNIDIGNVGVAGDSGHIRIGSKGKQTSAFIAGIFGTPIPDGLNVVIGPRGLLGTAVSSGRFKDEIKPMDKTSEAILSLKPVTFRYKKEFDPQGLPQFGLVAEEVERINPALVARDEEGKPYSVRYEAVNAMLLNEFIKEHRKVQEQEERLRQLEAVTVQQQNAINALAARLGE